MTRSNQTGGKGSDGNSFGGAKMSPSLEQFALLKQKTEELLNDANPSMLKGMSDRLVSSIEKYASTDAKFDSRFIPVHIVAALEEVASQPFVSAAMAELCGHRLSNMVDRTRPLNRDLDAAMNDVIDGFAGVAQSSKRGTQPKSGVTPKPCDVVAAIEQMEHAIVRLKLELSAKNP